MALEDRRNLYDTVSVDGNQEKDFLSSKITSLEFTAFTLFTVPQIFLGRLDLVSYAAYGIPDYWWLIAQVNDIMDPFSDMYTGQVLKIPSLGEYYTFYNANVRV